MAKVTFLYGTMKSGKSLDLIRIYNNYKYKNKNVLVIKPFIDTRDGSNVSTRLGKSIKTNLVGKSVEDVNSVIGEIVDKNGETNINAILVDEAQFLTKEQIDRLCEIADSYKNLKVFCYGLKTNFNGVLFEGSKRLLEIADKIVEIKMDCQYCNNKAILNFKKNNGNNNEIEIGDDIYTQVCRFHFNTL